MKNKSEVGNRRTGIAALLLTAVICLLASAVMSADNGSVEVDQARTLLEKWVDVRRIISQEKRDWALSREVLNERIDLVQREIESLHDKIGEAKASIAAAEKERAELIAANTTLKEASASLSHMVMALEARTAELLQQLPEPIRVRVRPLIQRIPENPAATKLSLAERFQNVIGILNEVNKFNSDITVTSEVHTLRDGTAAEVTVLYVGIGKAYYVSSNGSTAGVGTASPDGWVWTSVPDAAGQVAKAIAILKNEQAASFVELPVDIQ